MARNEPQVNLRMPAALKEQLEKEAESSKRSLTAEIIARLERSFSDPTAMLGTDVGDNKVQQTIIAAVRETVGQMMMEIRTSPRPDHSPQAFYEYSLAQIQEMPKEDQPAARKILEDAMTKLFEHFGEGVRWTPPAGAPIDE